MKFKEWLLAEAKFLTLHPETEKSLRPIMNKILQIKQQYAGWERDLEDNIIQSVMGLGGFQQNGIHVGDANVVNQKTGESKPIPVYIGHDERGFGGHQGQDYAMIGVETVINSGPEEIMRTLSHEVGHAAGIYQGMSNQYQSYLQQSEKHHKAFDKNKLTKPDTSIHYTEPVELDAISAEMTTHIADYYHALQPAQQPQFIEEFNHWLRSGGNLPAALEPYDHHFSIWQQQPQLWKKMKMKLWNFIQQLPSLSARPGIYHQAGQKFNTDPQDYFQRNFGPRNPDEQPTVAL